MTSSPTFRGNLFDDARPSGEAERFDTLLAQGDVVVERIVSSGPVPRQVFVQAQDEWVMLVRGEALLEVGDLRRPMTAGDHVFLPAGTAHAVTTRSEGAVWLAVHLYPHGSGPAAVDRAGADPA